jgi:hypothetical protein
MHFAPSLTKALKLIADDLGGVAGVTRNSVIETRIHNFINTHACSDQVPSVEEWFADLQPDEIQEAVLFGPDHPLFNTAPAFTLTILDNFASLCNA